MITPPHFFRRSFFATLAALLSCLSLSRAVNTVLLDEQFNDTNRVSQNLPSTADWFYQGNTATTVGILSNSPASNIDLYFTSQGQDIAALSYFTVSGSPKTLADGESLSLRLSTRFVTSVINTSGGLRVGLFNSSSSRATTDYCATNFAPANLFTNYGGYSIRINPGATSIAGLGVEKRTNAPTATNLFNNVSFSILASDTNGPNAFPVNLWVRPSLKLTRLGSAIQIEALVNDTLVVCTDTVPNTFAFDTIGICTSAAGLPVAAQMRLDDILLIHSTTLATNITSRGSIISQNFNSSGAAWPTMTFSNSSATGNVSGLVTQTNTGTIDAPGGLVPGGGLHISFDSSAAVGVWSAQLLSGQLNVTNSETNLAKLTLAFDLLVSSNRPVRVGLESLTAGGISTGKLERRVHPAAAGCFQRCAFELSTMTNSQGTFDPLAPQMQLYFAAEGGGGPPFSWPSTSNTFDVDNIHLARPAYYVSPTGSDTRNGWTESNSGTTNGPFLTISKAITVAKPGDIVLIMGTGVGPHYQIDVGSPNNNGVQITNLGAPAGWITFKAYPGQTPEIQGNGWNVFRLGVGFNGASSRDRGPGVGYLEVRGLKLRGVADTLAEVDKGSTSVGSANTTGITVEGRYAANQPHHIRLADNIICTNSGGGIGALQADYVSAENNIVFNNCNWSGYAPSGISFYQAWDFAGSPNVYRIFVLGNTTSNNQSLEPWTAGGKTYISDGNGIIIDNFSCSQNNETMGYYPGRSLVQNNLTTGNGGSGMHAYTSKRVDVINNTSYKNSQVITNGELWSNQSDDVRFYNNIMVSPANRPINPIIAPGNVYFYNNLYQVGTGGAQPVTGAGGSGNVTNNTANIFVNPAVTGGDFRLTNGSPAFNLGQSTPITPTLDNLGYPRGTDGTTDSGAYERQPMILSPPNSVTSNAFANLSFSINALGDALTYKWTHSGTNLPGQTAATLTLNNVTVADSGNYSVVTSTSFDSITNSFTLTVALPLPPVILPPYFSGSNQLALRVATQSGFNYILLGATNLNPSVSWKPVITNNGTGGTITNTIQISPALPAQFFRYSAQ